MTARNELIYRSVVANGKLAEPVSKSIMAAIKLFEGKEVKITLKKYVKPRTLNQNAWYWKVLTDHVVPIYRDSGHDWDAEDVHEVIVSELGYTKVIFRPDGKPHTKREHTSEFDVKQFSEFYERFVTYCSTNLDVQIPDPIKEYDIPAHVDAPNFSHHEFERNNHASR